MDAAWGRRMGRQTEGYNEDNKRFSLFMRIRPKIKILEILSPHVFLGRVFSFKEETHPMGTLKKGGVGDNIST